MVVGRRMSRISSGGGGAFEPQGYDDKSGNRSFRTTYQNTTGVPIELYVVLEGGSDNLYDTIKLFAYYGPSASPPIKFYDTTKNDFDNPNLEPSTTASINMIVPDGYYYEIADTVSGSTNQVASMQAWEEQELR
jgi:hypothetical protein